MLHMATSADSVRVLRGSMEKIMLVLSTHKNLPRLAIFSIETLGCYVPMQLLRGLH